MKLESGRLKKAAPWVLGGLTGAFLFANFAGSACFHYNFVRPKRKKNSSSDLTGYVPEAHYSTEEFQFASIDGILISGIQLVPKNPNGNMILVATVSPMTNTAVFVLCSIP